MLLPTRITQTFDTRPATLVDMNNGGTGFRLGLRQPVTSTILPMMLQHRPQRYPLQNPCFTRSSKGDLQLYSPHLQKLDPIGPFHNAHSIGGKLAILRNSGVAKIGKGKRHVAGSQRSPEDVWQLSPYVGVMESLRYVG